MASLLTQSRLWHLMCLLRDAHLRVRHEHLKLSTTAEFEALWSWHAAGVL